MTVSRTGWACVQDGRSLSRRRAQAGEATLAPPARTPSSDRKDDRKDDDDDETADTALARDHVRASSHVTPTDRFAGGTVTLVFKWEQ